MSVILAPLGGGGTLVTEALGSKRFALMMDSFDSRLLDQDTKSLTFGQCLFDHGGLSGADSERIGRIDHLSAKRLRRLMEELPDTPEIEYALEVLQKRVLWWKPAGHSELPKFGGREAAGHHRLHGIPEVGMEGAVLRAVTAR